ncbi:MAG TPA: SagB family peptide dehydrogenase [Ktedonobacteraceae bacterium]|nr:SagB family peptide dehydrogenase [Ktedonobacteraceae bacterium]
MDRNMHALPISYRLQGDTEMRESGDGVVVISPFCQVTIARLSPPVRRVLMRLARTACPANWIQQALQAEAQSEKLLASFYQYIACLLRHRMVALCTGNGEGQGSLATLFPISSSIKHTWVTIQMDQAYQMSRFAYLRRDENGSTCLESPLSHARIRLERPLAASLIYQLGSAVTPLELSQGVPAEEREHAMGLLTLLVMGDFAALTTSEGQLSTEQDQACQQWEFHDLLFHSRSRAGRHDNEIGGTYRFLSRFPPQPAIKQSAWPLSIPLFRPDMQRLRAEDPALTDVLEKRTSLRSYGEQPITANQLGEFLYRVARVKEVYNNEESGDFTSRPYPGAGASYELELYLTIEQCEGLAPGFYWYHPVEHALALVREDSKETQNLLFEASQAMGSSDRPQVLITLAARFQRVAWKYQSLAYSLILKDVGVLYATMYLVATAMKLAPCALGAGDSDLFAKIAATEYLKETSVGEFMLGSRPADMV